MSVSVRVKVSKVSVVLLCLELFQIKIINELKLQVTYSLFFLYLR